MRKWLHIATIILLLATSCRHGNDADGGYTPVYQPTNGAQFRVDSLAGGSMAVVSLSPWQGAGDAVRRVVVPPGGARRIVVMSSTHVAMLEALGRADRIVGASCVDLVSSPSVASRRGEIVDVGYEGNVDYELIVAAHPDLVMLYGVNAPSSMERKLESLGIPYMYVGDYLEESPLAKLEWIVAVGAAVGAMERGIMISDSISAEYQKVKLMVDTTLRRPVVMVNKPYNGAWFMPSARSYVARLVEDAGGRMAYEADTGNASEAIDAEQVALLARKADVWLNPGSATTLASALSGAKGMESSPAVARGMVYNNNRRCTPAGGNDYYESGVVHPDVVLLDMACIFNPGLAPRRPLVYYRQLE